MKFFLVIYIYAGAFAPGDNVALTTVPAPFPTRESCDAAGKVSHSLVSGSRKEVRFSCLPVPDSKP